MNNIYSLQNDLVFKAVFGRDTPESKQALIHLLNAILSENHHDPIQTITHRNPFLMPSYINEKVAILDIKAETETGEQINIEMQVSSNKTFRKRLLYYATKLHGEQLHQGTTFNAIKKTISIAIVSDILFHETKKSHTIFQMTEIFESFCFSDDLEIHCVQLPYISDIIEVDEMDALTAVMTLIKDLHVPQKQALIKELIEKKDVIRMTFNEYDKVTQDAILREQLAAREKYEHDLATRFYEERKEGFEEGQEQGIEKGIERGIEKGIERGIESEKFEIARKLKVENLPIDFISKVTGLSLEDIEAL